MEWLIGGLIAAILAAGTWLSRREPERLMLASGERYQELQRWAEGSGWELSRGMDFQRVSECERVIALTGLPGDRDEGTASRPLGLLRPAPPSGEGERAPGQAMATGIPWNIEATVARDSARSPVLLIDCSIPFDPTQHYCFASLRTEATISPYTLDVKLSGQLFEEGRPPGDSGDDFRELVDDLVGPARLRLVLDRILLFVPGPLSAQQAQHLVDKLSEIEDKLPVRPDRGPMR